MRRKARYRRAIEAIHFLSLLLCCAAITCAASFGQGGTDSLPGIRMLDHPQAILETTGCDQFSESTQFPSDVNKTETDSTQQVRLKLRHRTQHQQTKNRTKTILESHARDTSRLQVHHHRIAQKKIAASAGNISSTPSSSPPETLAKPNPNANGEITGTVKSGVSLGSGEYFMDIYIGTPARHFSVILDTGSDLNWVQCEPCKDCYKQAGPKYNPSDSSSYTPLPCSSSECTLANADSNISCPNSANACTYFYWYGDQSNTTGELAKEIFTVNTTNDSLQVPVVFGCGHANRGLFRGAAGLLGLGRGSLSFSSQLRLLYGHKFSYCLVDRDNNISVSSTLVLGEDPRITQHQDLRYTALTHGSVDTFYYVNPVAVTVGGKRINVSDPQLNLTNNLDTEDSSGTIVDSGTTLTYFAQPAYDKIKEAFEEQISFPRVKFPPLNPCFNVSGVADVNLPEFSLVFEDSAVWDFPAENYFIQLEPEDAVICLAIMGTPRGSLSILGNYLQQNFHILYDVDNSRLGFAPATCATLV